MFCKHNYFSKLLEDKPGVYCSDHTECIATGRGWPLYGQKDLQNWAKLTSQQHYYDRGVYERLSRDQIDKENDLQIYLAAS